METAATGHLVYVGAWERPVAAVLVLLLVLCSAVWAWRRGWLWRFVGAVGVVVAAAWVTAALLMRSDYRDADGWVDCWPSCTPLQDGVGTALTFGPLVLIVLVVVAAVLAAISRPRSVRGGA